MAVHYYCRHCSVHVGTLEQSVFTSEQLGFNHLNVNERRTLISYQDGDIVVKTICENCQETLERYPDYYEHDYFIH